MEFKNHTYETTKYFSFNGLECQGRLVNVIDGDTYVIIVNQMNDFFKIKIRLNGINAMEIDTDEGKKARKIVLDMIKIDSEDKNEIKEILNKEIYMVKIKCYGYEKYGRVLADLFINEINVSDILLKEKVAVIYK